MASLPRGRQEAYVLEGARPRCLGHQAQLRATAWPLKGKCVLAECAWQPGLLPSWWKSRGSGCPTPQEERPEATDQSHPTKQPSLTANSHQSPCATLV